jgi:flagellar hook-associated protein 2
MPISSPGIGSGLDVKSIVSQLVALERRPIELLQTQKTKLNTQLSSFGLLQSYVGNLQSAAGQLAKPEFWAKLAASSSDATAVAVTAGASAAAASYSVEVQSLATAQTLSTAAGAITDAADIGSGTLTITLGATPVALTVTAGTSLAALRDQINAANAGASAAIVQDSGGPRLVFTARNTGAANAVSVTVSGAVGQLASFTYPGALTQDRAGANAAFKLNGLQLSSASNKLTDIVDGLTLTLHKASTSPVQVTVGVETAALRKGITDFVAAYNESNRYLTAQTKYDEGSKVAGALQGDRSAVGLQAKLRSLVQQASTASATYPRLSDLGLELQRDGSLKVNDTKLDAALANPAEVALAFNTASTGFGARFKALADTMLGTDGMLTSRASGLRESIKRNEKDQQRQEDRVARVQARITQQYSALDKSLNQLNGLGNYVQQQITTWNNSGNNN